MSNDGLLKPHVRIQGARPRAAAVPLAMTVQSFDLEPRDRDQSSDTVSWWWWFRAATWNLDGGVPSSGSTAPSVKGHRVAPVRGQSCSLS